MTWGEYMAWFCVMLLAVYGCTQGVRRLCLWMTRCPRCAECCRLAVPLEKAQLEPLVRCLQSQAIWEGTATCRHTLVVLPDGVDMNDEALMRLFAESPAVIPVTCEDLVAMVTQRIRMR